MASDNQNQYTSRTVPGALDVLGSAHSNADIKVNGQAATRQGAYYYKEAAVTNGAVAVWQPIEVVGVLTNITVTNSGHLFLPKTAEAFTFDLDGNQTSDGRWTNTWDGANRLIAMETTAAAVAAGAPHQKLLFTYDSQWRRVSKVVSNFTGGVWAEASNRKFIYDGWNLLAEIGAGGSVVRSYVWGLDLSGSMQGAGGVGGLLAMNAGTNGTHFAASDGNGNVVGLYKSNDAAVTAVFEYDPFGNTLRATGPMAGEMPIRFSTKYTDIETGRVYYGMRYYDPDDGRWLNRDPIAEKGGRNIYVFVANTPVSRIDILGLTGNQPVEINANGIVWANPYGPQTPGVIGLNGQPGLYDSPSINHDPDGRIPLVDALGELYKGYKQMKDANVINSDKWFHCMAMCNASKKSGDPGLVDTLARFREIGDLIKGRFDRPKHASGPKKGQPFTNEEHAQDSLDDMKANRQGFNCPKDKDCKKQCEIYLVPGLNPARYFN